MYVYRRRVFLPPRVPRDFLDFRDFRDFRDLHDFLPRFLRRLPPEKTPKPLFPPDDGKESVTLVVVLFAESTALFAALLVESTALFATLLVESTAFFASSFALENNDPIYN